MTEEDLFALLPDHIIVNIFQYAISGLVGKDGDQTVRVKMLITLGCVSSRVRRLVFCVSPGPSTIPAGAMLWEEVDLSCLALKALSFIARTPDVSRHIKGWWREPYDIHTVKVHFEYHREWAPDAASHDNWISACFPHIRMLRLSHFHNAEYVPEGVEDFCEATKGMPLTDLGLRNWGPNVLMCVPVTTERLWLDGMSDIGEPNIPSEADRGVFARCLEHASTLVNLTDVWVRPTATQKLDVKKIVSFLARLPNLKRLTLYRTGEWWLVSPDMHSRQWVAASELVARNGIERHEVDRALVAVLLDKLESLTLGGSLDQRIDPLLLEKVTAVEFKCMLDVRSAQHHHPISVDPTVGVTVMNAIAQIKGSCPRLKRVTLRTNTIRGSMFADMCWTILRTHRPDIAFSWDAHPDVVVGAHASSCPEVVKLLSPWPGVDHDDGDLTFENRTTIHESAEIMGIMHNSMEWYLESRIPPICHHYGR